jgi:hypothetical protein
LLRLQVARCPRPVRRRLGRWSDRGPLWVGATEDGERTYDWRKLGNREFENFFGESAEDVKKDIVGSGGSKFDLYEDKCTGEIFVLRKSGVGEPQPTGYRFPK